jgi:pyruvate/2-oxoglutarate dehydrogenase complex dihydrolipoamide acyltransferase (E2) component
MSNIEKLEKINLQSFRKLAIGSWSRPKDPQTYVKLTVDVSSLLEHIKNLSIHNNQSISMTHVLIKYLGMCLKKYPFLNRVMIRKSLYQRKKISIFVQTLLTSTNSDDPHDLSGVTIENPHLKSFMDIASEVKTKTLELRKNKNSAIEITRKKIKWIPNCLMPFFVSIMDFVLYTLNINGKKLGVVSDSFGSLTLSNVGAFGIDEAFVPLFPFSRCPIGVAMGKVVNNQLTITFTFDHRYIDGIHGGKAIKYLRKLLKETDSSNLLSV